MIKASKIIAAISSLLIFTSLTAQKQQDATPVKIDFSFAGYKAGGVTPPNVPAVLYVRPTGGDDTKLLQSAIDYIGKMPVQKNGFRGALQLREGRYKVSGHLMMDKSGVVIRGSSDREKTVIEASGIDRRTLIQIGTVDSISPVKGVQVTNTMVAAGSLKLNVDDIKGFNRGNRVVITRPCIATWISDIGMNKDEGMFSDNRGMRWPVGSRVLRWDRIITSLDVAKKEITLDAPITTALQQLYGGGTVRKLTSEELVSNVGLEGFTIESDFKKDNGADEEHSWIAIQVNYSEDVWVRDVTARYFVSSAVRVGPRARRVSVINCLSEHPVSEIAGYRRNSFLVEG
jgi:hypothetical protein